MTSFINDVLKDLHTNKYNLSELIFVLPSKRAGIFLRHELSKVERKTLFSPQIISIEEFVSELSQLKSVSNTELLFEFYETYKKLTKKEATDTFDSFAKWAQILLQDFNEIDRYLITQDHLFDYLSAIQDLKHWSNKENQTTFIKNYLYFWNRLKIYYEAFTSSLVDKKIGYQGLIYREAVDNIESYIQNSTNKMHVFLGFNALNKSEETIIQELLQNDLAKIYWDIDQVFFNDKNHDASLFIRQHTSNWKHYKTNPFNWITNNYSLKKNINVIGVPKQVGQAKYIGSLLKQLSKDQSELKKTAVVLGEEQLLMPLLNSIPDTIQTVNITMGFPLKSIPLAALFESLFQIHKKVTTGFYYKDVIKIIQHSFIKPLFDSQAESMIKTINENNIIYLSIEQLKQIAPNYDALINVLFGNWESSANVAINNCKSLILTIKEHLDKDKEKNLLQLEYLFRFNTLFIELERLNATYAHIENVATLFSIYKELLASETLDFKGEPLDGLQIMGMLESRVLDFETIIISSVNEGILPAGKSNNSFIPFDVKLENKLPTYKEKDAVYTYHFYRLLQRAKNIYVIYNTEVDAFNTGEKSRFITQLELEGIHTISQKIVAPQTPVLSKNIISIKKDNDVLDEIKKYALKGFSPSALTSYIRNPIDFYYQKVLKIKEHDDIEETVAANTLGTVIHNTLEDFYKPYEGKQLTENAVLNMRPKIDETVKHHFKDLYKEGDINTGKNLIVFEIAKRYISNFLDLEIQDLKDGNSIEIVAIETENRSQIEIPELNFPVYITGKVDRIDKRNGITRIIDYKSGKVEQNKVELINWEELTTDYDAYSKSFQVLTYAYLMHAKTPFTTPIEAGIISFKNLSAGFLKFAKKDRAGSYAKKNTSITNDTLDCYLLELKKLILEICNLEIPFTEKDI